MVEAIETLIIPEGVRNTEILAIFLSENPNAGSQQIHLAYLLTQMRQEKFFNHQRLSWTGIWR